MSVLVNVNSMLPDVKPPLGVNSTSAVVCGSNEPGTVTEIDTPITITLTGIAGNPLVVELVTLPEAVRGAISNFDPDVPNSSATFLYTPAAGFAGTSTFEYLVRDAVTGALSNTATVTVNIPNMEKSLVSGPEEIGRRLPVSTQYVFQIIYSGPAAFVTDTLPSHWEVTAIKVNGAEDPNAISFPSNNKKPTKSAVKIEWTIPEETSAVLTVEYETRMINVKKGEFHPGSCGPFLINPGATAFAIDENGEIILEEVIDPETGLPILVPVILFISNSLEVEAVDGTADGGQPCSGKNNKNESSNKNK